ncbi:DPP IV N-terminal domain-containing protein [Capnocytophaga sp. ARDL2]|uniref:S9 family peptidase n=1 Tax=Capnocytophaga sp. ARDL2 TaxID=3238809 RepID=UPI003555D33C
MKKIILSGLLLVFSITHAQRNFTVQEATATHAFFPVEQLYAANWQDNEHISYLSSGQVRFHLIQKNVKTQKDKTILTREQLQTALQETIKNDTFNLQMIPFNHSWIDKNVLQFTVSGEKNKYAVQYDVNNHQIVKFVSFSNEAQEEQVAENLDFVIWLDKNNIKISKSNGETIAITNDEPTIVNGSSNTHRQEFGIDKGFWISPDQSKILFYSKNESKVSDYPLIDFSTRVATHNPIKYPMAGMTNEVVKLKIYDLKNHSTQTLDTGDVDQFLTMPTWTPDGLSVLVGVLNRNQNHLVVKQFSAKNGKPTATLFEQKSTTYVEPSNNFVFVPNSKNLFVYVTDINGYRQMYLYNTNGKLVRNLGYKDVVFKEINKITEKEIFYTGTHQNGMGKQLYKVDLKSGKTTQITKVDGTHMVKISDNNQLIFDQYSAYDKPNVVNIVNAKGVKQSTLLEAKNPYEGKINQPKVAYKTIVAADGKTPLNARIVYPIDFDANKKYPVMTYVYGGPHAQLVTNSFNYGATGFDLYMAQKGYVVFTLDNRGSDNRGRDFEHVIHRQLGQNEMADQLKGYDYLVSLPFVDKERIGVYGWSFGGFMATSLMLNHPDKYKVGVAGGPVIDWKWYEIMYGERYMDTPEQNPEGYAKTTLLDKVGNLQGRLLMIHGAQDPVVLQQHSMEFIEACIKAGKPVDYFLYPTHEHNVIGRDRAHLNHKIADYFDTHLK